jgi:hypothetical protein
MYSVMLYISLILSIRHCNSCPRNVLYLPVFALSCTINIRYHSCSMAHQLLTMLAASPAASRAAGVGLLPCAVHGSAAQQRVGGKRAALA